MSLSEPPGDLRGREAAPDRTAPDGRSLEALQLEKLRALLAEILPRNRFYLQKLTAAGISPSDAPSIARLGDLAGFPFTAKAEIQADQQAHPPYGSNLTYPPAAYVRLHQTSGTTGRPIRWLDTPESWSAIAGCWETIYRAAGVGPPDRVFVPFSFGPFLGFWGAFEGAMRLGMMVLPGGGMSSALRLRFLHELEATVLVSTPTYALRLAEVAKEEGIDLPRSPVRTLIVAGEPGGSIPAVRARIEAAWGARCFDHWGMTEVGPLGYQSAASPGGLFLLPSHSIAEVIDPATGRAAPPGTQGELVITTLQRAGSPLIRYRTGDLVISPKEPSGLPTFLAGGIVGRLDDMILVRGNNVYPSALEAVLAGIPHLAEYQVQVHRRGGAAADLRLLVEAGPEADGRRLVLEVRQAVQEALCFRPEVEVVPPGSLPRFEMKAKRFTYHDAVESRQSKVESSGTTATGGS